MRPRHQTLPHRPSTASGRTIRLVVCTADCGRPLDLDPPDGAEVTTLGNQRDQGRIHLLTVRRHKTGHT